MVKYATPLDVVRRTDFSPKHAQGEPTPERGGGAVKILNMLRSLGRLSMWVIIGSALLVLVAASLL